MDLETVEQLKDKSGHETDENNVGEGKQDRHGCINSKAHVITKIKGKPFNGCCEYVGKWSHQFADCYARENVNRKRERNHEGKGNMAKREKEQ